MVKRYYAQVVSFADDEVTDENIKKVIKYLIDFECNVPVVTGVVLSPRKIREI
jgi:MoaA/NifB/PqqE/SkfB family radical SAM enzyme